MPVSKNEAVPAKEIELCHSSVSGSAYIQPMLVDGKLFGENTRDLIASLEKSKFDSQDQENGIQVAADWKGDGNHTVYFTIEDVAEVLSVFRKLGFAELENIVLFSFFKEPESGLVPDIDIGPISCQPITDYSLATINHVSRKLQGQTGTEIIERAFRASNNPEKDKLFIPRIIIRHPLNKDRMAERVTFNYEPSKLKTVLQRAGYYDSLFDELVNTEFRTEVFEDMEAAVKIDTQLPIRPSHELAKNTILYGILHELCHMLVLHMPVSEIDNSDVNEHRFFELLRDNVPDLEVDDLRDSIPGRLLFKNWTKALRGVREYRMMQTGKGGKTADIFKIPGQETQKLAINTYANEMFCDLFPMFLMEKAGSEHPYSSDYGELLTEELVDFFNSYLELLQSYYKENRLLVFTEEHLAKSGMKQIMAIIAV